MMVSSLARIRQSRSPANILGSEKLGVITDLGTGLGTTLLVGLRGAPVSPRPIACRCSGTSIATADALILFLLVLPRPSGLVIHCWRATRQGIANWKLIEADECWEQTTLAAPSLVESYVGSIDFP
jgi:hypothetical protein